MTEEEKEMWLWYEWYQSHQQQDNNNKTIKERKCVSLEN